LQLREFRNGLKFPEDKILHKFANSKQNCGKEVPEI
jgi:hypothetical protein